MEFCKDFLWGAATSSYQIEGAVKEDGRNPSIWDIYSHVDGKIFDGTTGDIACDHYHRYKQDIKLMSEMGIKAYRFSVSWSRILPNGIGQVNEKGIAFYSSLIDELLKYNIKPFLTLYHWDLPYSLYLKGGWKNRDIALWFCEYATVIAQRFGDRVKDFITVNEPSVFLGCGCKDGVHAPFEKLCNLDLLYMAHNVHRAHGYALKAIKENVKDAHVSISFTTDPIIPNTQTDIDKERAYEENFKCDFSNFIWSDSFWADPVFLGKYPKEIIDNYPTFNPSDEDMKIISEPLDFIGLNIYRGKHMKGWERKIGASHTEIGWDVTPLALKYGPLEFYKRYKKPIYITENGLSCHDWVSLDGKVHDPNRIDFLNRYLLALKEAVKEGCDIKGYFQWSLMDNYEWAMGYQSRFGLIYIDYENQKRIPKDSYYWYKDVIKNNGRNL